MATVATLGMRHLRTVGDSVPLLHTTANIDEMWPVPDGRKRVWFGSGTSALAAACLDVVGKAGRSGRGDAAEFIVPAYTCPDVISAIEYAGGRAILCDLQAGRPWLDIENLKRLLTDATVAVVAVNFQGIDEDLEQLVQLLKPTSIPLIYDHCQGLPRTNADTYTADYLVYSFGRGKPSSALGGGAVVAADFEFAVSESSAQSHGQTRPGKPLWYRIAYNLSIRPLAYGLISRLPGVAVGVTKYNELENITTADRGLIELIGASYARSLERVRHYELLFQAYREKIPPSLDFGRICNVTAESRLLRYPVLMPSHESRDLALRRLDRKGLGATSLYPDILSRIPGAPKSLRGDLQAKMASAFCARLIALPVHSGVQLDDIDAITKILLEVR